MKTKWDDRFYVRCYELARAGRTKRMIAAEIGVTWSRFVRWMEARPALLEAITSAPDRSGAPAAPSRVEKFFEFVYGRLPPELKNLWDEISAHETDPDGAERTRALLRGRGKRVRQHLFLYALVACNFNKSLACRKLNMSYTTPDVWARDEPGFAALVGTVREMKKDFVEGALLDAVYRGDSGAVIFANKTLNRDRGYGASVDVNHTGAVNHLHAPVDLRQLLGRISVGARREILAALRAERAGAPALAAFARPDADADAGDVDATDYAVSAAVTEAEIKNTDPEKIP